jgi:dCTP deaminase
MSYLCDWEIKREATVNNLITPFEPKLVRTGLSYGLSSSGYDIRLDSKAKIFKHLPGKVVDVKSFDSSFLEGAEIITDNTGSYFVLPGNSYALGISYERFEMGRGLIGFCLGKSTYARAGIIVNVTPLEPGWSGKLVIEISNAANSDCKIYVKEGICQIVFYQLDNMPDVCYLDRCGKYQNQIDITLPRVVE